MSPEPAPFIPPSSEEHSIPPAPWRLFGTRPFFKLWLAQVFSSLGDWVGFFAILQLTARVSHDSAAAFSLVIAARMVPGFFLATLGGVIVDRFDRRKVMVCCDLGRAALICTLPFVDSLALLVVVSFCIEILTLLWGPAKDASVPHFVPEENLATANSLSLVASYGTFPLAALIAAALSVISGWLGGFQALHSLKDNAAIPALWFDAVTYVVSAVIVFGLPIPRRPKRVDQKLEWTSTFSDIKDGLSFIRTDRFARGVIVGLGGGVIGAGAMVPLSTVFATEVLGSKSQFLVLLFALGTGCAIGVFGLLAFQKRLPRDTVFEWSIIGAGICLAIAAGFNEGGLAAVMIAGVGACAGAAYITGFTVLQETVTDELRGRTFATLYAVVRLCLLLSLTVSPLFADLYEWLFSLAAGAPRITLGGFSYGFPGVRLALWGGAGLTILSGLYARHELRAMRALGVQERHPANGAEAAPPPSSSPPEPEPRSEPEPPPIAEASG
ncbi:MAG: MFS transporter [Acidimicrobiia bacterium]